MIASKLNGIVEEGLKLPGWSTVKVKGLGHIFYRGQNIPLRHSKTK